jgi:BirA family biotin operon repressor/biotin-[acetyl-CoA-carboxylase] ligase
LPSVAEARYDGHTGRELEHILRLPRVVVFREVGSTLDVAHALAAEGAPAGTLVIADSQTAGRGRMGRAWQSDPGAGVWLTIIERPHGHPEPYVAGAPQGKLREGPAVVEALDVLSLRVGLALAEALDDLAPAARLKWPNDLYVEGGKLAGVLIETRWRNGAVEWVALGAGINVRVPAGQTRAAALAAPRMTVLERVVPAIRAAARVSGHLMPAELEAFAARDLAAGRACIEPVPGRVRGIDASGALVIDTSSGVESVRAGSLVFTEERPS